MSSFEILYFLLWGISVMIVSIFYFRKNKKKKK